VDSQSQFLTSHAIFNPRAYTKWVDWIISYKFSSFSICDVASQSNLPIPHALRPNICNSCFETNLTKVGFGNNGHCFAIIISLSHSRWALTWKQLTTFWSFCLCTTMAFPKMIKVFSHRLLHSTTTTIKEGNDIATITFFVTKPPKKAMVVVITFFRCKGIEESDENYCRLLLHFKHREEGDIAFVVVTPPHKKAKKKAMIIVVVVTFFFFATPSLEEGDSSWRVFVTFFFSATPPPKKATTIIVVTFFFSITPS